MLNKPKHVKRRMYAHNNNIVPGFLCIERLADRAPAHVFMRQEEGRYDIARIKTVWSARVPRVENATFRPGAKLGSEFLRQEVVDYYMLSRSLRHSTLYPSFQPRYLSTLNLHRTMSSSTTTSQIDSSIVTRVSARVTSRRSLSSS